jgi:hypothetical protein
MRSNKTWLPGPVRRAIGCSLLAGLVLSGCRLFTTPGHDTARIEIESATSSSVRLITASEFIVSIDDEGREVFHLFEADTAWVQLPFSAEYDLRPTNMFYARAAEADDPSDIVSLRAFVDGTERFFHQAALVGAGIQFYYVGF